MLKIHIIVSLLVLIGFMSINDVRAEVWIPENEFRGYYDSDGIFTVVGAVKNTEDYPVIPSVTFNVQDNGRKYSESHTLSVVDSEKDIPFKIKLPQIDDKNATLEKPEVKFEQSTYNASNINVIYDKTLRKYSDGHTSGYVVNNDTSPAYGVKVYAVIYGKDGKFLDIGKSVENITKMNPGEKFAFSMYPDPQYASKVSYYSCFNIAANSVETLWVERGGNKFYFSLLTSGAVADKTFDDSKQSLAVTVRYPFPDKGFVNFMFPLESKDQKFSVMSNGKPVEFVQSKDPEGYWHVALDLPSRSVSHLVISGFGEPSVLPMGGYRNYVLIMIPIVAAVISIIIWKKKKD